MVNAQTWLDQNYPKNGICISKDETKDIYGNITNNYGKKRSEVKRLIISGWSKNDQEKLTGILDVSDFVNLEELHCPGNGLTKLVVNDCLNINYINCWQNEITELSFSNLINLAELTCSGNYLTNLNFLTQLNPNKLEMLKISGNNLVSDLTPFSRFVNLKKLEIGNWSQYTIESGVYNRWIGGLQPFKGLSKLKELSIEYTEFDSGLEYLPADLETIRCTGSLVEKLKGYEKESSYYDYQAWRRDHPELVNRELEYYENRIVVTPK